MRDSDHNRVLLHGAYNRLTASCLLSEADMEEYEDVYAYLENSKYPEGLTKDGKRNWRRKHGQLFFYRKGQSKAM